MGLRPFSSWDCGFEYRRCYGCLSLEIVVLSRRALCVGLSTLPEGSYRVCVCVCLCVCVCVSLSVNVKALALWGCRATEKIIIIIINSSSSSSNGSSSSSSSVDDDNNNNNNNNARYRVMFSKLYC